MKTSMGLMAADACFLQIFTYLAEGHESKRIEAAKELVTALVAKQGQSKEICGSLSYSLSRLLRGLTSNRKWARLGFSLALTQVLRQFSILTVEYVLEAMKNELKKNTTVSKAEIRGRSLGWAMLYITIIQSRPVAKNSSDELSAIVCGLQNLKSKKSALHHICCGGLSKIIQQVDSGVMKETVLPIISDELECGWDKCSPDSLLLLLQAAKHHKDLFNKKFFLSHWGCKSLFGDKTKSKISEVLAQSTADHPIVHPVCDVIIEQAPITPFFSSVIGDLLQQSMHKKYLCLQLIPRALKRAKTEAEVSALLSPQFIQCLTKMYKQKDKIFKPALQVMHKEMEQILSSFQDNSLQVAMVMPFLTPPGSTHFDKNTCTSTVSSLVNAMSADAVDKFSSLLKDCVLGNDCFKCDADASQLPLLEIQKWSVNTLSNLITHVTKATNHDWQLGILQFLFQHAFFKSEGEKQEIPKDVSSCLQQAFFRALSKLASTRQEKGSHWDKRGYIQLGYDVVQFAQVLLNKTGVLLLQQHDKETKQGWDTMFEIVTEIHSKNVKDTSVGEGQAFELLFVHHGLQLFTEPLSALDVLAELHSCFKKAKKKRRKSMAKADNEPEWVDVIVDLLLSLLLQESHLVRVVVNTVFHMLSPHLTTQSLELVLDVLRSKGAGGDESLLGFEDEAQGENEDDINDDVEEPGNNDDDDDGDDKAVSESSSDDESDDEDDNDDVLPEMRNAVKQALGSAAVNSDEEDDEDFDDEAMFRLDDALAAAFRGTNCGKKKEKEQKQLTLRNYKSRCFDLIDTYIKSSSQASVLISLIKPLLELVKMGESSKESRQLSSRAQKALNSLCRQGKLPVDPSLDQDTLPELAESLIQKCTQMTSSYTLAKEGAIALLFVVRVMLGLETDSGPSPLRTRSMSAVKERRKSVKPTKDRENLEKIHSLLINRLQTFCEKRSANHSFFIHILERQSVIMWPVAASLIKYTADPSIRIFCKTQVCAMLTACLNRNLVQNLGDEWSGVASDLINNILQVLVTMETKENRKPKYLHDMLCLLHKAVQLSEASLLKEKLPADILCKLSDLMDCSKDVKKICNRIIHTLRNKIGSDLVLPEKKPTTKKRKANDSKDGPPAKLNKAAPEPGKSDTKTKQDKKSKGKKMSLANLTGTTKSESPAETNHVNEPKDGKTIPDKSDKKQKKSLVKKKQLVTADAVVNGCCSVCPQHDSEDHQMSPGSERFPGADESYIELNIPQKKRKKDRAVTTPVSSTPRSNQKVKLAAKQTLMDSPNIKKKTKSK